ncbi:MAG: response regulator [Alphaproteobacteria bacterium]|nr:response regulator [Alphaproteobacteria bacterium]
MLNRLNILIVDDEPDIATLLEFNLSRSLKAQDLRIQTVSNGTEALRAVQISGDGNGHPPYDIILTDYNMPGMNGVELTSQVRTESGYLTTPIIMLTATADFQDIRRQALESGASEVLTKPFSLTDLKAALERNLPEAAFTAAPPPYDPLAAKATVEDGAPMDLAM